MRQAGDMWRFGRGGDMELAVKARICIIYFEKGKNEEKRNPEEGLPEWCICGAFKESIGPSEWDLSEMPILNAASAADLLKPYHFHEPGE